MITLATEIGTMKILTLTSVVSVLCAVSVWLFVAPQVVMNGIVELGPFFELMVVLPVPVGLICALVGVVAGTIALVRQANRTRSAILMTVGQVLTWVMAIVIAVWAQALGSTGWELLVLSASLMLGQIAVAVGLIVRARARPRSQGVLRS